MGTDTHAALAAAVAVALILALGLLIRRAPMGNGQQRAAGASSGLETAHRGITTTLGGIARGAGALFAAIVSLAGLWWCVIHMSFLTMIIVWTTLIGGSILIGAGISRSDPSPRPPRTL